MQGGHPSPPLSPGPAERALACLLDQPDEPDWIIAKLAGCRPSTVRRARAQLEALGHIPAREPELSEDAYRPPSPSRRAEAELMADPARSNFMIAGLAGCHRDTVIKMRRQLEARGEIPAIGAWDRKREPGSGRTGLRVKRTGATGAGPARAPELPPMPAELSQGLCATGRYDPALWHPRRGGDHGGQAIAICRRCPALAGCREWSLQLPPGDWAIYGAMTASERYRLRRAARLP